MKKNLLRATVMCALVASIASCNKSNETTTTTTPETKAEQPASSGKIAYVDLDSVQANYELCKELTAQLEEKSLKAQQELQSKQRAFQDHYNSMQQKYEKGQFTSEQQFQNAQANLQREQEAGAKRESEIQAELAEFQAKGLQQMNDSINNFIESYNKDKKYDYILVKSTVLYANSACDITADVIKGLNKRYKK